MKTSDILQNIDPVGQKFTKVGDIVSLALRYVYVLAGLLLLGLLVWGGIELMTAGADPARAKAGYGKLTAGLVGFMLIFVSYFVAQILEIVLGVRILG